MSLHDKNKMTIISPRSRSITPVRILPLAIYIYGISFRYMLVAKNNFILAQGKYNGLVVWKSKYTIKCRLLEYVESIRHNNNFSLVELAKL